MIQIDDVYIRLARASDAPEIAYVHIASWQESYKLFFSESFLNSLSYQFRRRTKSWESMLDSNSDEKNIVSVAESKEGIVGFCIFQKPRDLKINCDVELTAIYVREKFKSKKIGKALLDFACFYLRAREFKNFYCWVIKQNPSLNFYKKVGGVETDFEKTETFGDRQIQEVAVKWSTLDDLGTEKLNIVRFCPVLMSHLVETITTLLHRAYAVLAKMGMNYTATNQDSKKTLARLTEGESYLLFDQMKLIGIISLVLEHKDSLCQYYNRLGVFSFHQFGIDPDFQGKGLGDLLLKFVETRAQNLGAKEIALDTSERATHLINYYEKRGYKFVQHVNWGTVNYRSVVMAKSLSLEAQK